jgi:hypothetical protein
MSASTVDVMADLHRLAAFALDLAWQLNAEVGRFCTDPIHEQNRLEIDAVRDALDRTKPDA